MEQNQIKIKVWDISVRLFHWCLLGLLFGLWWSAENGEMDYHQILAYVLLILLSARILWGFFGSDTAKFSHFVRSPKTAVQYAGAVASKTAPPAIGHNPLGGYMVVALMLVITIQLVTGLFATDDIITEGPLMPYVSYETAEWLTWLHKKNFNLLMILGIVHIVAVIIHEFKGERLIKAMITGDKELPSDRVEKLRFGSPLLAILLFLSIGLPVLFFLILPLISML